MKDISSETKGHFLRLYQMAMTDGEFSPEEWKMLYRFGEERDISKEKLDEILLNTTGVISIPESIETRIEYLYDLAVMIWADNEISPDELVTLKKYCRKFEFLDENIDELSEYLLESAKMGIDKSQIINEL